mgnify:CR=1 FL=1
MKNIFLILTMIASLNAFSKTHELLLVTSSEDSEYSKLFLDTDDQTGEVLNLIVKSFDKKHTETKVEEFSYEEINDRGAILSESEGHNVVVIKKIQVDQSKGGKVTLDLLGNAMTGQRLSYELFLNNVGKAWEVRDATGKKTIKQLHFVARKFLGQAVGIKSVETK